MVGISHRHIGAGLNFEFGTVDWIVGNSVKLPSSVTRLEVAELTAVKLSEPHSSTGLQEDSWIALWDLRQYAAFFSCDRISSCSLKGSRHPNRDDNLIFIL